ncbi:MAG: sel1 repeat family protein [Alphaproteobacteria bacterium]|nr:sel1 repeat family protein [Alphaproteobacteria bacterium]
MRALSAWALAAALAAGAPALADPLAGARASYDKGDMTGAFGQYKALAESGDPRAETALAMMYFRGEGTKPNLHLVESLLQSAAGRGHGPAAFTLGRFYLSGGLGLADPEKAQGLFEQALDKGEAGAAHFLSLMHYGGLAQPRDLEKSAKYARIAADAGLADAQYHLGMLYFKGEGVPRDELEAYYWVFISSQHGFAQATGLVPEFNRRLSREQLMTTELRASQWRKKIP